MKLNAKLSRIINDNLQKVRLSNRSGLNLIKKGSGGLEHELLKAEVAMKLMFDGHHVMTDAIFADNSGSTDIFILSIEGGMVYEILHTESDERFNAKNYPVKTKIAIRTAKAQAVKDRSGLERQT